MSKRTILKVWTISSSPPGRTRLVVPGLPVRNRPYTYTVLACLNLVLSRPWQLGPLVVILLNRTLNNSFLTQSFEFLIMTGSPFSVRTDLTVRSVLSPKLDVAQLRLIGTTLKRRRGTFLVLLLAIPVALTLNFVHIRTELLPTTLLPHPPVSWTSSVAPFIVAGLITITTPLKPPPALDIPNYSLYS